MNNKAKDSIVGILPGLIVCILIAILSKILSKFIPSLGAATLSIFIGILIGNTIGKSEKLNKGTKFSEGTLLSISVVLLGATLSINSIFEIGVGGILFIIFEMIIVLTTTIFIGRKMKFSEDFVLLMASGNAVCGSSAVASTAPVIDANSKDKGIAITMVNVTGTVLMILLPVITLAIFNNELIKTSAFMGGILQSVGQVVASASMINEETKELATIFKIVRIVFLVFVVFALAAVKKRNSTLAVEAADNATKVHTEKSKIRVPWYIIGFFITCILYSINIIPHSLTDTLKDLDNFLEIIALAGIGMRVKIADLIKQGAKSSLYCLYIGIVQIISAAILIFILL